MAFWDDVGRNVGNFFGGIFGGNDKKKKDEEKQQVNRAAPSPAPRQSAPNRGQTNNIPKVKQPTDLFGTLNNTGNRQQGMFPGTADLLDRRTPEQRAQQGGLKPMPLAKPNDAPVQDKLRFVKSPKKTVQQELDELTEQNMDAARKNVSRGQGFWGGVSDFFTGNNEKIARQNARNKAVSQYQEKNGWNADPEVMKYIGNTRDLGEKTSREIRTQGENLNKFSKGMDKAAQVIQYVPVAGSVFNLGLAGNEQLAKSRGTDIMGNSRDTARGLRNKVDFGMTNEEYDALDDETKGKLETVRNIGLALSPLDFTGLGGLAKSTGVGAAKKGITQLVKDGAIDAATKTAIKTSAKGALKSSIPATVLGTGASAGIQGYLTGEVDPLEALKAGLMTGGTSMLIPNGNQVNVPGSRLTPDQHNLVNSTLLNMADRSTINVDMPRTRARSVPVVNNTPQRPLISDFTDTPGLQPIAQTPIRDIAGDTPGVNRVSVPLANERAAARFAEQPTARPDSTIEGMIPRGLEDTTLYRKSEIDAERTALDEALANKEINKTQHKAAMKNLDELTPFDDPNRSRTQIDVKQVQGIPVRDAPVDEMGSMPVPTRKSVPVTDESTPNKVEVPTTKQEVALPADVQEVLSNPRKFTKRQVEAARNQRKLARQMAKTKEQTAEAIGRIDSVSPEAMTNEGFVPTGEFGKSVNGGTYQKTSRATEMQAAVQETANMSPGDVLRTARENQAGTGGFNRRDIRNIAALFETKRIQRGTPEWEQARQILKEDGTIWGQTGALRNYTMRRTASADELISRFESKIYRLADDPSKIDSKLFDEIDAAETKFVETRDAAMQAYNRFTEQPTSANAKAYHAAQDAAEQADKQAKQAEFKVANSALKGNKDVQQVRELEKMAQSADMYQMDAVDASMLSGTGTFVRNFTNATISGIEEGMFGGAGARISSKLTGQTVGGGVGRNSVSGFKDGMSNIVDSSKARASVAGKNPLEHAKNWATTGNQLGDSIIDSQVKQGVSSHYTQLLKNEGYKGRELRDRASVMARQDPDNVSDLYQQSARVAAGLGSGVTRNNKVETTVKNIISDAISGGKPNKYTENTAKLITRLTLGFPTAIGRSVAEGAKRFTLGAPTFVKAAATKDPQMRALLIKEGIKQAGSGGLVIPSLFYGLGTSGIITGGYPDDKSERERWAREGITENSIKIGDDYYQLPAYLGSWAIPGLFYASLGRNGGDWGAAATDVAKAAPDLLPTGGIDSVLDVINGRKPIDKYMSQLVPSAVRASTPAGALLNQLAKSFDPTQNDTNSGTTMENIVSKIMGGIPGLSNMLPDKTDAEGNVLTNPDPLALAAGASSTVQDAGVAQTQVLNDQTNSAIQGMADGGAFSDPNLKALITDEATKKIYTNIINGKQVSPDDLEKVQKAMVKGVSETGSDTAYLEREQYDTNLTVLNLKRQMMAADPTTKPSDLTKMDTAIKRGEVYRDNEIPYELISAYQDTGVDEWRKMGDPDSDEYNEELYQQLWAIDELMTENGVSYKKGSLDKQKYSAKKSGSGRGGSGGSKMGTDFGTLKTPMGAPTVQEYDTIDSKSGQVPVINVQRPNIVHKISSSG